MIKAIGYISIILTTVVAIIFLNLGKFFDTSEAPKRVDIIVCLGGGDSERLEKSLELYLKRYSKSNKIILTGTIKFNQSENKISYLMRHAVPKENIVFLKETFNTMHEVLHVKNYLLENNLKSVIFITDPPHSRRIIFLANTIAQYKKYGLSCSVVGSGVSWWNKKDYYKNSKAVRFVVSEMLKFPANYIAYGILKPLGLFEPVKEHAGDFIHSMKYHIQNILK